MSDARAGRLFAMSAPAGTGKDTVIRRLKETGCPLYFPITYTTRPRRENEIQHVHYHFVTPEEFRRMAREGMFLETAEYNGNMYGSPRHAVEQQLCSGRDVLLKIEVQGARSVRSAYPNTVSIFLSPPSLGAAVERMQARNTETADEQRRRAEIGEREMAAASEFDYVVINQEGRLDDVVREVRAIIDHERAGASVQGRS